MVPLPNVLHRSRCFRCKGCAELFAEASHLKGSEPVRAADFRWQARVLGQEMIPKLTEGWLHHAAPIFFGFELCHAHIMYWNILEPSTWQLSPLATTAVVIHLQWMLDRNRVQSVYIYVPGPRNFNSNCLRIPKAI